MPTPSAASASWGVGSPSTSEDPARRYLLGGVSLPATTPATGADLLGACDPFLAALLPYLKHVFNKCLAAPFVAAMAGQAAGDDAACVETLPADYGPFLGTRGLKTPLLAGYPVSAAFAERTTHYERMVVTYRVDYLLPALDFDKVRRVAPLLQAAAGLVLLAVRRGGDPSYLDGRRVLEESKVEAIRVVGAEFGVFSRENLAQIHPELRMTLEVALREFDDDGASLPLWGHLLTTLIAGDGDALTFADTETTIP